MSIQDESHTEEPGGSLGYRAAYPRQDPRLKSPVVATLLSIMPGLGQAYLGYYQLGFINVLVVASIISLLASDIGALTPLAAIFLAFFWLFNLVDAARRAVMLNQVITRLETPELPAGFNAISVQGRVFGGLVLIAAGTLAIAHIRFGFSLAWLHNWWPAALVILGVYLVWKAVTERKE